MSELESEITTTAIIEESKEGSLRKLARAARRPIGVFAGAAVLVALGAACADSGSGPDAVSESDLLVASMDEKGIEVVDIDTEDNVFVGVIDVADSDYDEQDPEKYYFRGDYYLDWPGRNAPAYTDETALTHADVEIFPTFYGGEIDDLSIPSESTALGYAADAEDTPTYSLFRNAFSDEPIPLAEE